MISQDVIDQIRIIQEDLIKMSNDMTSPEPVQKYNAFYNLGCIVEKLDWKLMNWQNDLNEQDLRAVFCGYSAENKDMGDLADHLLDFFNFLTESGIKTNTWHPKNLVDEFLEQKSEEEIEY